MTAPAGLVAVAVALLLPFGWVLPGDRVLREVERQREKHGPVRVELTLEAEGRDWPGALVAELHPEHGARISDSRGGRWLTRHGQVVAANPSPVPAWVPDLEPLVLRDPASIRVWLDRAGVDFNQNELGRCGDRDCFVLGGREGRAQVWIDKDRFQVVRLVLASGRRIELSDHRNWGGRDFPSRIEVFDHLGRFASLRVERLQPASGLSPADFDPAWAGGRSTP